MDPLRRAESRHDGRNVDPEIGALLGEGAQQRARDALARTGRRAYGEIAAEAARHPEGTSYYGLPLLCEPVWKWMIPAYFFTGGLSGACAVLAGALQLAGTRQDADLVRRCRRIAAAGSVASAALLVSDLGRPARFLNMLRVFRPTSPMNMGTWVLSGFGACAAASVLPDVVRPRRRGAAAMLAGRGAAPRGLVRAADAAGLGAAGLGLPLVGYTGVLLANTAVPVWQQARHSLPVLFAFSGAVSAGALLDLFPPRRGGEIAHRFGLLARGAELAASAALEREASRVPRVARPLRHGASGAMLRAARAMVIGSLAAEVLPLPRRARRLAAGALALVGTIALRFGIERAGHASARDPLASFEVQRAGLGAADVVGSAEASAHVPSLPGIDATGKDSAARRAGP